MTRASFLAEKGLTQTWRDYLNRDETVRAFFSVVEDENPARNPESCPEKDPLVRYGYTLAYGKILKTRDDLAVVVERTIDPTKQPSSYGTKRRQKNANGN